MIVFVRQRRYFHFYCLFAWWLFSEGSTDVAKELRVPAERCPLLAGPEPETSTTISSKQVIVLDRRPLVARAGR